MHAAYLEGQRCWQAPLTLHMPAQAGEHVGMPALLDCTAKRADWHPEAVSMTPSEQVEVHHDAQGTGQKMEWLSTPIRDGIDTDGLP